MSSARVRAICRKLERHGISVDLILGRSDVLAPAMAHLEAIEQHVEAFIAALQPGAGPVKLIEGAELWQSLATAVVAIARAKRSGRFNAKDLKDLVEEHAPARDLAFWVKQYPGRVLGLLREEPQVRKLIESHGVLFWEYPGDPDEEWRIVSTRWYEAHGDIRRWVTKEWSGGRRCRFCACMENPHVDALQPIELHRRNGVTRAGDTVVLPINCTLTHEPCRPHFIQWLAIAAKYPTQEAAEQADAAAGRKSRYEKAVRTSALLEASAP
jgi:hypothetical protein